jgi:hypothetical protein
LYLVNAERTAAAPQLSKRELARLMKRRSYALRE